MHQPLGGDGHLTYQGAPVPTRMNQLGAAGRPKQGSFFQPDPDDETATLRRARQHTSADDGELTGEDTETRPTRSNREPQGDIAGSAKLVREAGREVVLVAGDIRDEAHCGRIVELAVAELGRTDVLVNNAAYQIPWLQGRCGHR